LIIWSAASRFFPAKQSTPLREQMSREVEGLQLSLSKKVRAIRQQLKEKIDDISKILIKKARAKRLDFMKKDESDTTKFETLNHLELVPFPSG